MDQREESFIDGLGDYYEGFGVPRIGGRILGLLLVARSPLTAERISALLAVSRGSVSTNVRLLISLGLLRRVAVRGQRADSFEVPPTAWEAATRARVEGFRRLSEMAREGLASLGDAAERPRLREMVAWAELEREGNEETLARWRDRRRG